MVATTRRSPFLGICIKSHNNNIARDIDNTHRAKAKRPLSATRTTPAPYLWPTSSIAAAFGAVVGDGLDVADAPEAERDVELADEDEAPAA